ncbi:MAG: ElyC/SanA/YdcF family protein [Cyclonatronaceae bacterium]
MFEPIARFILSLLMPMSLVVILVIVAGMLYYLRRIKTAITAVVTAFLILLLAVTPYLPNRLITGLEDRYPVLNEEMLSDWHNQLSSEISKTSDTTATHINTNTPEIHIIVLGGGHSPDSWLPATNRLSSRALLRLAEGIRLYRMLPGSRLVFSGWSSSGGQSVAEVMGMAAVELGTDADRISLLTESSNTCREAQDYFSTFGTGHPLILVTSASHMPRALQLFRQTGLDPLPAPAGHYIKFSPDRRSYRFRPELTNVTKLNAAIKEHTGMVWGQWNCVNHEKE